MILSRLKKWISVMIACVFTCGAFALVACDGANSSGKNSASDTAQESGETDMSKFPNYVEPEKAEYAFGDDEIVTPYWKGNVIYNETVMLVDYGEGALGNLQYTPVRILSVRD